MIELSFKPYLRDGIDVYINDKDKTVVFVFLSTRERIQLNVDDYLVLLLPEMDGTNTIKDLIGLSSNENERNIISFITYLVEKGVLTDSDWFDKLKFSKEYKARLEKQIYFLMDVTSSTEEAYQVQNKIKNTSVALWGVGAVGSWVLIELLQMGFEKISIFDFDKVNESDVSRHGFFSKEYIDIPKVEAYQKIGNKINPSASITSIEISLNTETDLEFYLNDMELVINSADEPYIGYTSISLSRYCIKNNKLLFVTGGFDAHLASLGEMIVPFKTPCSDCYNSYFKKSLKDWKPVKHVITNRDKGIGGLVSLNIFSASTAMLSILQYFISPSTFLSRSSGRGEFKFDSYSIDSFTVKKDPNCEVCREQ